MLRNTMMGGGKVPFYVNDALKIAGGDVSISAKVSSSRL